MAESTPCCYHGDKKRFDSCFRDMSKSFHIPRKLSKMAAMAVCQCRKKVPYRTPLERLGPTTLTKDDNDILLKFKEGGIKKKFDNKGQNVGKRKKKLTYKEKMLKLESAKLESTKASQQDDTTSKAQQEELKKHNDQQKQNSLQFLKWVLGEKVKGNESAIRICSILQIALKRSFPLLEEEFESRFGFKYSRVKRSSFPSNPAYKKLRYKAIIVKLKRKLECTFSSDIMLPEAVRKDDPKNAKTLHWFSLRFKPCVIELDKAALQEYATSMVDSLPVNVWCKPSVKTKVGNSINHQCRSLLDCHHYS